MNKAGVLAVVFVLFSACSADEAGSPPAVAVATTEGAVNAAVEEKPALSGRQAYEKVCATCHAEGRNGAPVAGDTQAWSERSPLWEAVLFEHANEGFLGMPSKGADPGLTKLEVKYAAEYMLGLAYPERPTDPH